MKYKVKNCPCFKDQQANCTRSGYCQISNFCPIKQVINICTEKLNETDLKEVLDILEVEKEEEKECTQV